MEIFSFQNTIYLDETNNEVSGILNEIDFIIGNNDLSDSINEQKVIETNISDEKTIPIFTQLDNSFNYIDNKLDFFEKHFASVESSSDINSFENSQESLHSTLNLCTTSDSNVNDIDTTMLNESFKNNAIKRKPRNLKKGVAKDHSRRYREKEKKIQRKLELELNQKSELNDFLTKKVNLLNNLIELFKFIYSFKTN